MNVLAFFVAVPLGAAFLEAFLGKAPRVLRDTLAVLATLVVFVLALGQLGRSPAPFFVGGWSGAPGAPLGIQLTLDGLSSLLLVIVSAIALLAAVYSTRYMERYTDKAKYWSLFLLMVAGMNGVVLSGDLFNLYVFLEVAALASYALVAFGTGATELEASFKYQVMGTIGSAAILLGIALIYGLTGTLNMAAVGQALSGQVPGPTLLFAEVLFLVGFGLKAAQVPFHAWLPDAHPSAPAPISALLSGVLIKSLGVYALIRIFFCVIGVTREIGIALMTLGSFSMVIGVVLALGQRDIKRMLGYSSVSQVGYLLLAFGVAAATMTTVPAAASLALLGALFHLVNHATFKSLLFLNSGAIEHQTGTRDLKELGGLRRAMPFTSATGTIGSLAIAGVPPFNGFWSKLLIIVAAVEGGYFGLALVATLVAILTLTTFVRFQGAAYQGALPEPLASVREAPFSMVWPMVVLAALCIGLGLLLLDPLRSSLLQPAVDVLRGGVEAYGRIGVR